jgi:hypothetical protein
MKHHKPIMVYDSKGKTVWMAVCSFDIWTVTGANCPDFQNENNTTASRRESVFA